LRQELTKLWSRVEELKSNSKVSTLFGEPTATSDNLDPNNLTERLQQFQMPQQESKKDSEDKNVVFTLCHDNSHVNNKFDYLRDVENRLRLLEKIVGSPLTHPSVRNLTSTERYLRERLESVTDKAKLDTLIHRAQALRKELQLIQVQPPQVVEDQAQSDKINAMFNMMQRWDQAALQLPSVVGRLKSIKILHEESVNIVEKVNNLDAQHKLINQSLEANQQALQKVSLSLAENVNMISSKIQSFESKLVAIQDKVKKLGK